MTSSRLLTVIASVAALATLAGCSAGEGGAVGATASSGGEATPVPSGVATVTAEGEALEYPGAAAEDQALIAVLATFEPSEALLEEQGLGFRGLRAGEEAFTLASEWTAYEHRSVDPAVCGPVVNLLGGATNEDSTTRADDPTVHTGAFFAIADGVSGFDESTLRARILDDPESASAMADLPASADACTAFAESGSVGALNVEDVVIARIGLDGVDAPVTRIDVHIVDLVDEAAGSVEVIDLPETTYYVAIGRVMVRFEVHEALAQDQVAAAVIAELADAIRAVEP
ncbi:hypothetical protein QQX10_04460 [Demequina sp. SYSU T00039]|uniref:PknH-like extracellular domain-containing protein n=1 Tax=Demequina lignilytica TaxID=3051663 RepID=A0AAW7M1P9_9MICO|nr:MULTISPECIES: hypothetical protein [unclassified Demequina]MDN4477246.1 hypothetical protein [Demequina sp. SYSU T00039-1]MDN4487419.1 hypothetical protein [Demequina sp. SYSU T00039]MDN4491172.1 hypothetical protein [Demequina sp. SYSU T00068]